jgi:integrase
VIIVESKKSVGMIANEAANKTAHARFQKKKSHNTRRRQIADIALFCDYLEEAHYEQSLRTFVEEMRSTYKAKEQPQLHDMWNLWNGVTYGLVEGFVIWQEMRGYAIGSINVHLSTVKAYCRLAHQAGAITQTELGSIFMVKGYSYREGINLDEERAIKRIGKKKAEPTIISPAHADLLKRQDRPKDAAMICLLLDMGLREGELVALTRANVHLIEGSITFYREKVAKTQTHRLTGDCMLALQRYIPTLNGIYLFPGYRDKKTGKERPMRTSAINKRVGELGRRIGIADLSPHDCRHYLFTEEVKMGTDTKTLQDMGGWNSPIMALRYAASGEIANSGASFFRQRQKGK